MKKLFLCLISYFIYFSLFSQTNKQELLFDRISNIDYNSPEPDSIKLKSFYFLKTQTERIKPLNDSAYALVLIKISKYEFLVHNDYQLSISFANNALNVANSIKRSSLKPLIINCYYNIASSYQNLMLYKQALNYYDTVISLCDKNFVDTKNFQLESRFYKIEIYRLLGDYQKIIDGSNEGINTSIAKKDSAYLVYFLNRKAQALSYIDILNQAYTNAFSAITIARELNNRFELSISYKVLGFIYEKEGVFDSSEYYFKQSIYVRNATSNYEQIANDYIDLGNFYLNSANNYKNAQSCYYKALFYASKTQSPVERSLRIALANLNLGENCLVQKKFKEASDFFLQSFSNLKINLHNNIKENPASAQLSNIANKDLVIVLMKDKTNLLLQQYKTNRDKSFLTACLQSAIVTDSVITQIRHEQLGEQSKLYWRDKTRDFYATALEACYLANNSNLAFFFMEKSRAVLLNDKLNELDASAYLSSTDAAKQESFQIKIVELEQRLNSATENSTDFKNIQLQLLDAKNDFEHFIKSLEIKYPAYYQYKYEDEVPSLTELQSFLKKNKESFVHYFMGDSATYILAITPNQTKLLQLPKNNFDKEQLSVFLQLCANKEALNNHYHSFAELSNHIYKEIFEPLQLPKGRVIICADNIIIPFDALCKDATGKSFLLNDYSFSYVYSARYLMKQFNNPPATGSFLGFAPVSFASYLDVRDLKNAAIALHASAAYYNNNKIFTHQDACRSNFFKYVSSYSVVGIFSHARADTTDNEPVLYMHDSLIHLSELQLLNNPATKLILLSACQTNVGKSATGEGIYSLARGFATAGISSVAATLWKADEQTIYTISEKFNEYLSEGMNKDEALQKAKLYFVQHNSNSEKLLPYYWANMILIGNADAILLQPKHHYYYEWLISGIVVLICLGIIFLILRKK
jgi:CHAT domain-containing protein